MKSIGVRAYLFFGVLALSALACSSLSAGNLLDSPLVKDDFSDSTSGWGTGTDDASSVEYADGGLKMIVYQPRYVTWSTPDTETYENVHVEITVNNQSSDPQAFFGIVCNEQGSTTSFYYMGISSEGYYAFIKSAEGQQDEYLKEGNSDAVAAAASSPIQLGLDCGNGTLTLYVNGQQIDTVSDASYTSGGVGIFVGSDDEETGATVTFDNFALTKLK
ncbi:MAG: hypothetical protein HZB50_02155 [Chloroflexi bacterium]|nr:hypothetical protein [Chloroflexota bacterium]